MAKKDVNLANIDALLGIKPGETIDLNRKPAAVMPTTVLKPVSPTLKPKPVVSHQEGKQKVGYLLPGSLIEKVKAYDFWERKGGISAAVEVILTDFFKDKDIKPVPNEGR